MQTRFRYSRSSFRADVFSAAGLTLIVSCLTWLFLRLGVVNHALWWTAATGLIFFAFCSAAMIWRYLRGSIVLAVRPDGLFDARHSRQAVLWSDILELELHRKENEFHLIISTWGKGGKVLKSSLDLAPLDADVNTILAAISAYRTVEVRNG
jgi:hypothetical protein